LQISATFTRHNAASLFVASCLSAPTIPRRIDDDMNVVVAFCKSLDSINYGYVQES
jgi:hypothetical protein